MSGPATRAIIRWARHIANPRHESVMLEIDGIKRLWTGRGAIKKASAWLATRDPQYAPQEEDGERKRAWLDRGEQNMCPACGETMTRRHDCNVY